jgi:hypothetical protein
LRAGESRELHYPLGRNLTAKSWQFVRNNLKLFELSGRNLISAGRGERMLIRGRMPAPIGQASRPLLPSLPIHPILFSRPGQSRQLLEILRLGGRRLEDSVSARMVGSLVEGVVDCLVEGLIEGLACLGEGVKGAVEQRPVLVAGGLFGLGAAGVLFGGRGLWEGDRDGLEALAVLGGGPGLL